MKERFISEALFFLTIGKNTFSGQAENDNSETLTGKTYTKGRARGTAS